tara:strand:+ start:78 stop:614 length:537 start_codon:yes stop_codon:yes gene_type:complete
MPTPLNMPALLNSGLDQVALILAESPIVNASYVLQLFSRILHILGAIILVGGLFYIRTVLAPAETDKTSADTCYAGRRAIWARWVGIATFLLLLSGFYNFMTINGQAKVDGGKLEPTYHILFGIKFLLALLVMFIASILAGKTAAADRFRGQMRKWLNLGWLAAMAIVIIAAMMRTFH